MEFLSSINNVLTQHLGEFGPLIVVGVLGFVLIAVAVLLMLNQPEDPLKKLQRSTTAPRKEKKPKKTNCETAGETSNSRNSPPFLSPKVKRNFPLFN